MDYLDASHTLQGSGVNIYMCHSCGNLKLAHGNAIHLCPYRPGHGLPLKVRYSMIHGSGLFPSQMTVVVLLLTWRSKPISSLERSNMLCLKCTVERKS